jgi:hypothetical protein
MERSPLPRVVVRHKEIHPQLAEAVQILEQEGIHYWVDSGTLVGIMRDGDVLNYDKDIDLSVWYEEREKIEAIIPRIKALGYDFEVSEYNGYRYNYKFFPKEKDQFSMNIGIYRRRKKWAWRMAAYFTDNPHREGSLRWLLRGIWRYPLRNIAQWVTTRFGKHHVASKWPFGSVMQVGIWMIPVGFLEKTTRHETTGLLIPERAEEYLTYRYGDWRDPVKDWIWYRDDRAVEKGTPKKVVGVEL